MNEEQQQLQRAREIVRRSLALYDRLGEAWDGLTEEQQVELVEQAERQAKINEESL